MRPRCNRESHSACDAALRVATERVRDRGFHRFQLTSAIGMPDDVTRRSEPFARGGAQMSAVSRRQLLLSLPAFAIGPAAVRALTAQSPAAIRVKTLNHFG